MFYDDRGYIKIHNVEKDKFYYVKSIDYSNLSVEYTDNISEAKKYLQEDMLYHDVIFIQGFCDDAVSMKLPYSSFS